LELVERDLHPSGVNPVGRTEAAPIVFEDLVGAGSRLLPVPLRVRTTRNLEAVWPRELVQRGRFGGLAPEEREVSGFGRIPVPTSEQLIRGLVGDLLTELVGIHRLQLDLQNDAEGADGNSGSSEPSQIGFVDLDDLPVRQEQ